MKLVHNVFDVQQYLDVKQEAFRSFKQDSDTYWTSHDVWTDNLKDGMDGTVLCQHVSDKYNKIISECVKPHLPEWDGEYDMMWYVWDKGSGINWHNDLPHRFAATIYLNDNWLKEHGGVFLWQENKTYDIHGWLPKANTMVVNDQGEQHYVTPITSNALVCRHTIQIFPRES